MSKKPSRLLAMMLVLLMLISMGPADLALAVASQPWVAGDIAAPQSGAQGQPDASAADSVPTPQAPLAEGIIDMGEHGLFMDAGELAQAPYNLIRVDALGNIVYNELGQYTLFDGQNMLLVDLVAKIEPEQPEEPASTEPDTESEPETEAPPIETEVQPDSEEPEEPIAPIAPDAQDAQDASNDAGDETGDLGIASKDLGIGREIIEQLAPPEGTIIDFKAENLVPISSLTLEQLGGSAVETDLNVYSGCFFYNEEGGWKGLGNGQYYVYNQFGMLVGLWSPRTGGDHDGINDIVYYETDENDESGLTNQEKTELHKVEGHDDLYELRKLDEETGEAVMSGEYFTISPEAPEIIAPVPDGMISAASSGLEDGLAGDLPDKITVKKQWIGDTTKAVKVMYVLNGENTVDYPGGAGWVTEHVMITDYTNGIGTAEITVPATFDAYVETLNKVITFTTTSITTFSEEVVGDADRLYYESLYEGYDPSSFEYSFINTVKSPVYAIKQWEPRGYDAEKGVTYVTVQIRKRNANNPAQDYGLVEELTLRSPNWVDFRNLPEGGKEGQDYVRYEYYVKEVAINGVPVSSGHPGIDITESGLIVVNSKVLDPVEQTRITVNKKWDGKDAAKWQNDNTNENLTVPSFVTLMLTSRNEFGSKVTYGVLNTSTGVYVFDYVSRTDASGRPYDEFIITEVGSTPGFAFTTTGVIPNSDGTYTANINNVSTEGTKTELRGRKFWLDESGFPIEDNNLPQGTQITLRLLCNGVPTDQTFVLTKGDGKNWEYLFENLPMYTDGVKNSYSVVEVGSVEHFTPVYVGNNILNVSDDWDGGGEGGLGGIKAVKTWIGVEPREGVTLWLYKWDETTQEWTEIAGSAWHLDPIGGDIQTHFFNAAVLELKPGTYKLVEKVADGVNRDWEFSSTTVEWTERGLPTLSGVNRPLSGIERTNIPIKKVWNDNGVEFVDAAEKARYHTSRFQVYRDGIIYGNPITLTDGDDGFPDDNEISYIISNLPVSEYGGKEYVYTVVELPNGYTTSTSEVEDGVIVFTNTMEPMTNLGFRKKWDLDPAMLGDIFTGISTITILLQRTTEGIGGEPVTIRTVPLNINQQMAAILNSINTGVPMPLTALNALKLPEKDPSGARYKYTLSEVVVTKNGVPQFSFEYLDTTEMPRTLVNKYIGDKKTFDVYVRKSFVNMNGVLSADMAEAIEFEIYDVVTGEVADRRWITGFDLANLSKQIGPIELPMNRADDGSPIEYMIRETKIRLPGGVEQSISVTSKYFPSYIAKQNDLFVIENSPTDLVLIGEYTWRFYKAWDFTKLANDLGGEDTDEYKLAVLNAKEAVRLYITEGGRIVASGKPEEKGGLLGNLYDSISVTREYIPGAVYTATEDVPPGFTAEMIGEVQWDSVYREFYATVLNTSLGHTYEKTTIKVEKHWNGPDEELPDCLTVVVRDMNGGMTGTTLHLNRGNGWKASVELPKKKVVRDATGAPIQEDITYGVYLETLYYDLVNETDEHTDGVPVGSPASKYVSAGTPTGVPIMDGENVVGYTFHLNNTYKNKTDFAAKKKWVYVSDEADAKVAAGKGYQDLAPAFTIALSQTVAGRDPLTVTFVPGNKPEGSTFDFNNTTDPTEWVYTYTDLPEYVDIGPEGTPNWVKAVYALVEPNPIGGYERSAISVGKNGTITNTQITFNISGTKTWADESALDAGKPKLYARLTVKNPGAAFAPRYEEIVAGEFSFANLPTHMYVNGVWSQLTYVVTEGTGGATAATFVPTNGSEFAVTYGGQLNATGEYTPGFTTVNAGNVANVTLTNRPVLVNIPVEKRWNDADSTITRPSVRFTLQYSVAGTGTEFIDVPAVTGKIANPLPMTGVEADVTWNGSFNGLPKYAYIDGVRRDITYQIVEDILVGTTWQRVTMATPDAAKETNYSLESESVNVIGSAGNLTLWKKNKLNLISKPGTKSWHGDTVGDRPENILVKIQRRVNNGTEPAPVWQEDTAFNAGAETWKTKTVTAADLWKYTFTDLIEYNPDRRVYEYYVREVEVPAGYEEGTVTNVSDPKDMDLENSFPVKEIKGSKRWVDGNNANKDRPTSIKLKVERRKLNTTDAWVVWVGIGENGIVEIATANMTHDDQTDTYSWIIPNLPKFGKDDLGSFEWEYKATEIADKPYVAVQDGHAIVNNRELINVIVHKNWVVSAQYPQKIPDTLNLTLYRVIKGGDPAQAQPYTTIQPVITKNTQTGWTITYSNLPKFTDDLANEYEYFVLETEPAGYTGTYMNTSETRVGDPNRAWNGGTITNTPDEGQIIVSKFWKKLTVDGADYDAVPTGTTISYTLTGRASGQIVVGPINGSLGTGDVWTATHANLPTHWNGSPITYTVVEIPVPTNFGVKYVVNSGPAGDEASVVLTRAAKSQTVDIYNIWTPGTAFGKKIWTTVDDGVNDNTGIIPLSLNLTLKRYPTGGNIQTDTDPAFTVAFTLTTGAVSITSKTHADVTGANNSEPWSYVFTNVDDANPAGAKWVYYVVEGTVPTGFDKVSADNGMNVENKAKTKDLYAKKTWVRPDSVTTPTSVKLTVYYSFNAANPKTNRVEWAEWTILGDGTAKKYDKPLPAFMKNASGEVVEVFYTVEEEMLYGYISADPVVNTAGEYPVWEFTNTKPMITISGKKTWAAVDYEKILGSSRPEVTIKLYRTTDTITNPAQLNPATSEMVGTAKVFPAGSTDPLTYDFGQWPKISELPADDNALYTYFIVEEVAGYNSTVAYVTANGLVELQTATLDIENTPKYGKIQVDKSWWLKGDVVNTLMPLDTVPTYINVITFTITGTVQNTNIPGQRDAVIEITDCKITRNANHTWTVYTSKDLPLMWRGEQILYFVNETPIADFVSTSSTDGEGVALIEGGIVEVEIENLFSAGEKSGVKKWIRAQIGEEANGDPIYENTLPSELTLTLMRRVGDKTGTVDSAFSFVFKVMPNGILAGARTGASGVTLKKGSEPWSYVFGNLESNGANGPWYYYVVEDDAQAGLEPFKKTSNDDDMDVENTAIVKELYAKKTWVRPDGIIEPADVELIVFRSFDSAVPVGNRVEWATWTIPGTGALQTFNGRPLPAFAWNSATNKVEEVFYAVYEVKPNGYLELRNPNGSANIGDKSVTVTEFTNTMPMIKIHGEKTWATVARDPNGEFRPGLTIKLYRTTKTITTTTDLDTFAGDYVDQRILPNAGSYLYDFGEQPKISEADDLPYTYYIVELIEGYNGERTVNSYVTALPTDTTQTEGKLNIDNTPKYGNITVEKKWYVAGATEPVLMDLNKLPAEITEVKFKLIGAVETTPGSGVWSDIYTADGVITRQSDNSWPVVTFDNLLLMWQGKPITYRVEEESIPNFTTVVSPAAVPLTEGATVPVTMSNTMGSYSENGVKSWAPVVDAAVNQTLLDISIPLNLVLMRRVNTEVDNTFAVPFMLSKGGVQRDSANTTQPLVTVARNGSIDWSYVFSGLEQSKSAGVAWTYYVVEDDAQLANKGLTRTSNNRIMDVANKSNVESLWVRKSWAENIPESIKALLPSNITVEIYYSTSGVPTDTTGTLYKTVTVPANGIPQEIGNLPTHVNGGTGPVKCYYAAYEVEIPGFAGSRSVEIAPAGVDVTVFTNSFDPTFINGTKVWIDANNTNGDRPTADELKTYLQLNRISTRTGAQAEIVNLEDDTYIQLTVTDPSVPPAVEDTWTWAYTNLPSHEWVINADGTATAYLYSYWVTELQVQHYGTPTYGNNEPNTGITNRALQGGVITNAQALIDIPVEKAWYLDDHSISTLRPATITFKLSADCESGAEIGPWYVTLPTDDTHESPSWQHTFTNLPETMDGLPVEYSIEEGTGTGDDFEPGAPRNYVSPGMGLWKDGEGVWWRVISNYYDPTSVEGAKTWIEGENNEFAREARPASISFTLMRSSTSNPAGEAVPATEIRIMTVGYENSGITKTGDSTTNKITVAPTDPLVNADWKWGFEGLPVYKMGTDEEYTYWIDEDEIPNYDTTYPTEQSMNVTNALKLTPLGGGKTWNLLGFENIDLPERFQVTVYRKGTPSDVKYTYQPFDPAADLVEEFEAMFTNADDQTTDVLEYTWAMVKHLPAVDALGVPYEYGVREIKIAGFTYEQEDDEEIIYDEFTNTVEDTEVSGVKDFTGFSALSALGISEAQIDNIRPHNVIARLWRTTEEAHVGTVNALSVEAVREGNSTDASVAQRTAIANKANGWTWTFDKLLKSEITITSDGVATEKPYFYFVTEEADPVPVNGEYEDLSKYEPSRPVNDDKIPDFMSWRNKLQTTNIKILKAWDDDEIEHDFRPEQVEFTVTGYVSDVDAGSRDVLSFTQIVDGTETEGDAWMKVIEGLPMYDRFGNLIVYRMTELKIDNYLMPDSSIVVVGTGKDRTYTVSFTNALDLGKIMVTKNWQDDYDVKDFTRPKTLTFELYALASTEVPSILEIMAHGEKKDSVVVDLSKPGFSGDSWSAPLFTDLPRYEDGKLIYYYVDEVAIDGYWMIGPENIATVSTESEAADDVFSPAFTWINRLKTIDVAVEKTWLPKDDDNVQSAIPAKLKVTLTSEPNVFGDEEQSVWLSDWNGWYDSFTELPMYYYKDDGTAEEINYTVTEEGLSPVFETANAAFSTADAELMEGNQYYFVFENVLKPIDIVVSKKWIDEEIGAIATDMRGDVKFELRRKYTNLDTKVIDEKVSDGTITGPLYEAVSFTGLPKAKLLRDGANGDITFAAYTYYVIEERIAGYDSDFSAEAIIDLEGEVTEYFIEMENTLITTSIELIKNWDDAFDETQNYFDLRELGQELSFRLYRKGAKANSPWEAYPSEANNTFTFNTDADDFLAKDGENLYKIIGLPAYQDANNEYPWQYEIKEVAIAGYVIDNERITPPAEDPTGAWTYEVTNTIDRTDLLIRKYWKNDEGRTGYREAQELEVTVTGYVGDLDGDVVFTKDYTIPAVNSDEWTLEIKGLLKTDAAGNKIVYTVDEKTKNAAYTVYFGNDDKLAVELNGRLEAKITNYFNLIDLGIRKDWLPKTEYGEAAIPEELRFTVTSEPDVFGGNNPVVILTAATGWSSRLYNLARYTEDGVEIVYTVTEESLGLVFAATKAVQTTEEVHSATLAEIDTEGNVIVRKWYEFAFENTLEPISIEVAKEWLDGEQELDDMRQDVTFELRRRYTDASGYEIDEYVDSGSIVGPDYDPVTFDGLPKAKLVRMGADEPYTDSIYTYYVIEDALPSYASSSNEVAFDEALELLEFKITMTNELLTTSIAIDKTWDDVANDEQNYYKLRPSTLTFKLFRRNADMTWTPYPSDTTNEYVFDTETVNLTGKDGTFWIHGLPAYQDIGNTTLWEYRLEEVKLGGYLIKDESITPPQDDIAYWTYKVTNAIERIDLLIRKNWVGDGQYTNYRELAPLSVTVTGTVGTKTVFTGDYLIPAVNADTWTTVAKDLLKIDVDGNEIVYSVKENAVHDAYVVTYANDGVGIKINDQLEADITNTFQTTKVAVKKRWDDLNNRFELRPRTLRVGLYANGATEAIKTADLTEEGNWAYVFENLPVIGVDGEKIDYTVREITQMKAYTQANDGGIADEDGKGYTFTLTNKLILKSLEITKIWANDEEWKSIYRPNVLTFQLTATAGGKQLFQTYHQLNVETNPDWKLTINELPAFDVDNNPISYRLLESIEGVRAYRASYSPTGGVFAFTNDISATQNMPMTITNTLDTTSVRLTKRWNNVPSGTTPPTVTIDLLANGKIIRTETFNRTLGMTYTFTDLPRLDAKGNAIVYGAQETTVLSGNFAYVRTTVSTGTVGLGADILVENEYRAVGGATTTTTTTTGTVGGSTTQTRFLDEEVPLLGGNQSLHLGDCFD